MRRALLAAVFCALLPSENEALAAEPVSSTPPPKRLRLDAGLGWVRHRLSFEQDLYDRLRKERANLYVFRLNAEWYPFFRLLGQRVGVVSGLEGRLSGSIADADLGGTYALGYRDFYVGVGSRLRLGGGSLGFRLTYAQLASGLAPPAEQTGTPDLRYRGLRAGLDARVDMQDFFLVGNLGFFSPFDFGEIGDAPWFPRISGYGIEGGVGAEVPLGLGVSLRGTLTLKRFLLEMNSRPEDASADTAEVAAGAVDSYLGGTIGASLAL